MRDWRVIFGRNVRKVRKRNGLTQEQLAFEADFDLTYVGGIVHAAFRNRLDHSIQMRLGISTRLDELSQFLLAELKLNWCQSAAKQLIA